MASDSLRTILRRPVLALMGFAAFLLIFPAAVAANTSEPIAQTGGMTASLPLLGTSLTVGVQLDAVGDISAVTLDPAGTVAAKTTTDHSVKFANADGTVKVTVRAKGSHLSITARATLDQLVGSGTWSADLFGTGAQSTVHYTIGKSGSDPTLSIDSVTPAASITSAVNGPKSKSNARWGATGANVVFSHAGYMKRLSFFVAVDKKDGSAMFSIDLTGRDLLKLSGSLADLSGARTWTAHLCDGTKVSVAYHVDPATAKVVYDSATGAPASEKDWKSGFVVRFDKTNVGVLVGLRKNENGTYRLVVAGHSGFCGKDGGCGRREHHDGGDSGWWRSFGFGFGYFGGWHHG